MVLILQPKHWANWFVSWKVPFCQPQHVSLSVSMEIIFDEPHQVSLKKLSCMAITWPQCITFNSLHQPAPARLYWSPLQEAWMHLHWTPQVSWRKSPTISSWKSASTFLKSNMLGTISLNHLSILEGRIITHGLWVIRTGRLRPGEIVIKWLSKVWLKSLQFLHSYLKLPDCVCQSYTLIPLALWQSWCHELVLWWVVLRASQSYNCKCCRNTIGKNIVI